MYDGMLALLASYLESIQVKNYSPNTVKLHRSNVGMFIQWCEDRAVLRPSEVTKPIVERYQRWLYHYRKGNGKPLSFRTQSHRLSSVRTFFRWLARQNLILYNPAADIELPKVEHRLPRQILTASEVEAILSQPDITTAFGLRDRAILETLYSTGMRRSELVGLELPDVDVERGVVLIRRGKGNKDRMVPIGDRALAWLDKYLVDVRPSLVTPASGHALFVGRFGESLGGDWLSQRVRKYVEAAEIGKGGACHLFRHTAATLMLENGADIRFIQEMLGHAKLDTTQIYTQVSIRALKEIHTATHPARLQRGDRAELEDD